MAARVGPFQVVRELTKAPGTTLVEAIDAEGARRLVQLMKFRAACSDEERTARQQEEKSIARHTAALVTNAALEVHAHGGTDGEDGARILFWALPWKEPTPIYARLAQKALDPLALLWVAVDLAKKLDEHHGKGLLEPFLSEHLVDIGADGHAAILGVPVPVAPSWVAEEAPVRLAPEEAVAGVVTAAGDVWRLGCLLFALTEGPLTEGARADGPGHPLPADFRAILESLTAPDPHHRPTAARAARALEALARVRGSFPRRSFESEAVTAEEAAIPIPIPTRLASEGRPDSLRPGTVGFASEARSEAKPSEGGRPDSLRPGTVGFASEARSEAKPSEGGRPDSLRPGTVGFASEARSEAKPSEGGRPDLLRPGTVEADVKLNALAAFWEQPILPPGESPWSEVVQARGAHLREHGMFTGVAGDIPVPPASVPVPAGPSPLRATDLGEAESLLSSANDAPPVPSHSYLRSDASTSFTEVDTGEIQAELSAAMSGFQRSRTIAAVLALLVFFGLLVLMARSGTSSETLESVVVPATNQVVLESEPPGAQVVSELDGRVLGQTPLSFLVPEEMDTVVFLVARGFEPLRLVLPSRGNLVARLVRLPDAQCEVEVTSPQAASVQGIEAEIGPGPFHQIRGAALMRPADGRAVGARVVACPALGGARSVRLQFQVGAQPATVRVVEPAGAKAFLDQVPIGTVPAAGQSSSSFVRVRVEDERGGREAWVLTRGQSEVYMPPLLEAEGHVRPDRSKTAEAPEPSGSGSPIPSGARPTGG